MATKPEKEVEDTKSGAKALHVHDKRGAFVREYSTALHGDDMQKNAEEYAKKIGGEVRKAR